MDTNYSLEQQNIGASLIKSDVTMTFSHCNLMFAVSCRLSHVLHRQVSRCSTDLLMTKNGRVCKNVLYDTVLFRFSDKYSFWRLKGLPKWAYFALCFIFAWCACIVPSLIEWTDFPHHKCRPITCFALPYSACTAVAHMRFHLPGDEFQFRHQTQQPIFFNRPPDHLTNHLLLPLTFYFPFDLRDQQVEE